jgi:3-hydroxyisobutyrate dehydrogenase-like beta-hydroxyacid dehydrogenase
MSEKTIGVIGLGLLGSALAERLLGAGFRVLGFDVDAGRCRALEQQGGQAAADPAAVAASCDRILLSLPTTDVVEDVVRQIEARLRAGQIMLDTTTGDPARTAELAARLDRHGVAYLDATVSGSSRQARQGEVVLMVGGRRDAYEACGDLFGAIAQRSFHVGPPGSGAKMKLATNLVLGLNRAALAEGLTFAQAIGLAAEQTLDVLMAGMAYSRIMETKGPKMVRGQFEPEARLSQHLKDVRLILEAAASAGTELPLSAVHRRLLEAAEAAGCGDLDNSAILRAFQRGVDPPDRDNAPQ